LNDLTQEDHLGASPRRGCELLEFRGGCEIGCSHEERIAGTYRLLRCDRRALFDHGDSPFIDERGERAEP
jgi:hypothetical protein